MLFFKKYIIFVLGICLCQMTSNNASGHTAHFSIPIPDLKEQFNSKNDWREMSERSMLFLNNILTATWHESHRNPRLAGAVLSMAGVFVIGHKYGSSINKNMGMDQFDVAINKQYLAAKEGLNKTIISPVANTMLTVPGLNMLTSPFLTLAIAIGSSIERYFLCSKPYMIGSFATGGGFYLCGHPVAAGLMAALILAKGWISQDLAKFGQEIKQDLEGIKAHISEVDKKNIQLHKESQEKIEKGIKTLQNELNNAKKTITGHVKNLGQKVLAGAQSVKIELSSKIDHAVKGVQEDVGLMFKKVEVFGGQVIELNKKLQDMPEQILQLTSDLETSKQVLASIESKNNQILKQNKQSAQKIDCLSQQLQQATDTFVETKKYLDTLVGNLADQITKFIEKTTDQVLKIEFNNIQLSEQISDLKKLLLSLQLLEQQNGESIKRLELSCKATDVKSKSRHKELKKFFIAQESSLLNLGTKVSEVDKNISDFRGVLVDIKSNQSELFQKLEEQKKEIADLQWELLRSKANHSEELMKLRQEFSLAVKSVKKDLKEIKQQNEHTQSMVQQTTLPYPQIVSGTYVPIYPKQSMSNPGKQESVYAQQLQMAALLTFACVQANNGPRSLGNGFDQ